MAAAVSIPAASVGFRRRDSRTETFGIYLFRNRSKISPLRFSRRFGNGVQGLHARCRVPTVFALGANQPPASDSGKEGGSSSSSSSSSSAAHGPPLLTILAGIVVFLFVGWVFKSIIFWLVGLIVNVPPS